MKKYTYIRKILCLVLCVSMLVPCLPLNIGAAVKIPTEKSIIERIKYYYSWAKKYNHNESFKNYCAHYVNLQLQLLEINTRYVGGNGNDEYDNYKNLTYTGGGRRVHNYPATNATFRDVLYEIAAQGPIVTDVLVGFQWTNTTAGKKYGHCFLIHGIIGNYVYFSDSFGPTIGGKSYNEGQPIKCTIDQLVAYYGRENVYTVEGLIWFEDEELTEALGGTPGGNQGADDNASGIYEITYEYGMRLRSGPGTNYTSLDVIPTGSSIYVTEVRGDWGYTYYNGKLGWTCLPSYTKRTASLPKFLLDTYSGSTIISRVGKSSLSDALAAAKDTSKYNYTLIAAADVKLTSNTSLGAGITLSLGNFGFDKGKYSFLLNGGVVQANKSVKALADDSLISENVSGGVYVYIGHPIDMAFTGMSFVINDNVALRLVAEVDGLDKLKNPEVVMITTDKSGVKSEYKPDSAANGTYIFTTDGIPARKLGDVLTLRICVRSSTFGSAGEVMSAGLTCSPVEYYVNASYGIGERFDNLLEAMLNYATEAQIYFDYNSSAPVNSILPLDKRTLDSDSSILVAANGVPRIEADSTVHIDSARLVLLDNVALRLHSSGDSGDSDLSLLVWTEEDYLNICKKAEAAGKDISEYLVKGSQTYTLNDEEGAFTLEDISAKKFADTYYFRLCQTDGNKVRYDYLFSYSVTAYCLAQLSNGTVDEIDPLCMAIAQYSAAAREYFGYEING